MREINNGLLAAVAKVKQAERATSELYANDFFSAQSGRAENNRVKKHAKEALGFLVEALARMAIERGLLQDAEYMHQRKPSH